MNRLSSSQRPCSCRPARSAVAPAGADPAARRSRSDPTPQPPDRRLRTSTVTSAAPPARSSRPYSREPRSSRRSPPSSPTAAWRSRWSTSTARRTRTSSRTTQLVTRSLVAHRGGRRQGRALDQPRQDLAAGARRGGVPRLRRRQRARLPRTAVVIEALAVGAGGAVARRADLDQPVPAGDQHRGGVVRRPPRRQPAAGAARRRPLHPRPDGRLRGAGGARDLGAAVDGRASRPRCSASRPRRSGRCSSSSAWRCSASSRCPRSAAGCRRRTERLAARGVWGAVPLGMVFALAFCPVSAALFFGSLIPLATSARLAARSAGALRRRHRRAGARLRDPGRGRGSQRWAAPTSGCGGSSAGRARPPASCSSSPASTRRCVAPST